MCLELKNKKLVSFSGTYSLYDLNRDSLGLLNIIVDYCSGWSIGHVKEELQSLSKTFDVFNTTIYSFLTNDVSQAYECNIFFDETNKIINAVV